MIVLPNFNPNFIQVGFLSIKYYSLAYLFGLLSSWFIIKKVNEKLEQKVFEFKKGLFDDFIFYILLGIIIGGRLGYVVFYNLNYYFHNPLEILFLWNGGMSFHGGGIGLVIGIYFFTKKNNIDFFRFCDLGALSVPVALFFGRIANFINLELYGKPTNMPWGMVFPTADNLPRHPTQLYEAFLEGICLFIILALTTKKTKLEPKCLNSAILFISYGIFRFTIEFFREPDIQVGYIFQYFTMGQLLSIPMIIGGIILLIRKKLHN